MTATDPLPTAADPLDPLLHTRWAAGVARGVAGAHHLWSEATRDLIQVAHAVLLEVIRKFDRSMVPPGGDVGGQLRGYAHRHIQSECRREAKRLRGGGMFHTHRPRDRTGRLIVVQPDPLSILGRPDPTGAYEPLPIPDHRGEPDLDPPEPTWSPTTTEVTDMASLPPIKPEQPAVRVTPAGRVVVGTSGVQLAVVAEAYERGHTPAQVLSRHPTLSESELFSALSWYARNRRHVRAYLDAKTARDTKGTA